MVAQPILQVDPSDATAAAFARTVISCMNADDKWGYDTHLRAPNRLPLLRPSLLPPHFPPSLTSLRRYTYLLIALALSLFTEVFTVLLVSCKDISSLVVVFSLGFIVCVVALLQIPFIKRRQDNKTYFGMTVNILVAIQISFAIIAASLPDLRALVARKFQHFSPLYHRSLVSAARGQGADEEQGVGEGGGVGRVGFGKEEVDELIIG
ncbi:hypothetical protein GQ44DRAFT_772666 [Phaeosphaeriaceae sp. PMI808]|nr:hypothetical protein GQ44DRAFT_772666 [Phaeosphaeriaceae sp. PMI808]